MNALQLTEELIRFPSVSQVSNADVAEYVEGLLNNMQFETERLEFTDPNGERKVNILGKKGSGQGGVALIGHSDVVPAEEWFCDEHGPFDPQVVDDKLYGRGSCDMKGPVACLLEAAGKFSVDQLQQPIYFVCTADEEVGYRGALNIVEHSQLYREMVAGSTRGVIAEPTRLQVIHAHKGSCGFRVVSHGVAAHSSTRKGLNANLAMIPFLAEMKAIYEETETDPTWQNDEFDPPVVSFNIGINDYTYAVNITPPQSICTVYYRPMPGQPPGALAQRARILAEELGLEYIPSFEGQPFYRDPDCEFIQSMLDLTGNKQSHTVSYGTDGAAFTELEHLVVCGPGDIAQAHTKNEWIELDQLTAGADLYTRMIERWCL